jgi:hypothetical protein
MTVTGLLKTVATPGTHIQVSTDPTLLVAAMEFRVVTGAVGDTYIEDSAGNVLRVLQSNASGTPETWRIESPDGSNTIQPSTYYVDAASAQNVGVTFWRN